MKRFRGKVKMGGGETEEIPAIKPGELITDLKVDVYVRTLFEVFSKCRGWQLRLALDLGTFQGHKLTNTDLQVLQQAAAAQSVGEWLRSWTGAV